MTISSTIRVAGPFVGDNVVVNLDFDFKVFDDSEVQILSRLDSSGADTELVLGADYTVALNGNQDTAPGGRVTLSAALATGRTAYVVSEVSPLQENVFTNTGGFYPSVLNDALDRLHALHLENREVNSRAVLTPIGETGNLSLPPVANRAGMFLYFDLAGNIIAAEGTADGPLRTELASLTDNQGLGLVGYDATASYPATSAGKRMQNEVWLRDFDPVALGGGTANATAFSNAVAEIIARGGGTLYLGVGTFDFSTELTIASGVTVNLVGEGERTIMRTTSATANLLTHHAWYSIIEGIKFTSNATRTAGYYALIDGSDQTIQHCNFSNDYIGIKMSATNGQILQNEFSSGASGARRIWATGGDKAQHIVGNCMKAQSPVIAAAGIYVDNNISLKIDRNQIISQGRCLHIAPGSGQTVQSLHSSNNDYDTATYGIAVEPTGTGSVYRCQSLKDHISNHSAIGALFSADTGAGLIDGFELNLMRCANNGTDGVNVTGATANNIRILGGYSRANAAGAGVGLGATVDYVTIRDVEMQAADGYAVNKWGVFVTAGADNYTIQGCNLTGQTTSNIAGHTRAATRIVKDNKGYTTEITGAGTLTSGTSSKVVTHGLSVTPSLKDIVITAGKSTGSTPLYVDTFTSTQFTVRTPSNAAADIDFSYQLRVRD